MFRNRELKVTMEKKSKDKEQTPEPSDTKSFENKAEFVLRNLEGLAVKTFAGVCIYVLLDTRRQVAVERIKIQK